MSRRDGRVPWFSVTLDDCDVQTFRSGGPGGQNQNKTETGVRIIHTASGARGESRQERSQLLNKRLAFRRMAETGKFRAWLLREMHRRRGVPSPEQRAEADMDPGNLKVEVKADGKWAVAGAPLA
jgi:protein subunit release factor B